MAAFPERRKNARRESDVGLDRDDLVLLMESYRNTIELNTMLIERQEMLNTGIDRLLTAVNTLCSDQADIKAALTENRTAETREHTAHAIKLYGIIGVLVGVIIALMGLVDKLWRLPMH